MTNWEKTGFYKAFLQMRNVSDKKIPNGEYTKSSKNHNTLEQVQNLDKYMGILEDTVVLLDADDEANSDMLLRLVQGENLNCMVTGREGGRGIHALFFDSDEVIKRCGTHIMTACGIVLDIKAGRKNGLECLKWEGVERDVMHEEKPFQNLPKYFMPINTKMGFADMKAGDGRNQALFNYILTLQSFDFTIEEARETIRIINKYVLKDPLNERELETILRDEAFQKPVFFKGKSFLHDKFGTYIKNNNHIVKMMGRLHVYKNGVYNDDPTSIEAVMLKHITHLKRSQRTEVMSFLQTVIEDNIQESDAKYVAFKNGILNVLDDSFIPFSPDIVLKNMIPWDYNPAAECQLVDDTINKISCGDAEIRALLEECVGYCFFRKNELGKAFILTGEGANGKSTFIDMIKTMLGDENVVSLDLKELGEKFQNAELFGKLANLGDDIGEEFIASSSMFKKLVTGERVQVQRKGERPFEFNNYAKMIFSANSIPRIKDKSGGMKRRMVIVPFEASFSKDDPTFRPYIKYELREQEAVERLILLGIQGLKRILKNDALTIPAKAKVALEEYEKENNSIISFIDEFGIENFENNPTKDIYNAYSAFCMENGLKEAFSNISFSMYIKKHYKLSIVDKKINGTKYRIFVKVESK